MRPHLTAKLSSLRQRIASRCKEQDGETLVETLISTLIIVAVFLMLATVVVAAANINAKAKGIDSTFNAAAEEGPDKDQVSPVSDLIVTIGGNKVESSDVNAHMQNGYLYYEHE